MWLVPLRLDANTRFSDRVKACVPLQSINLMLTLVGFCFILTLGLFPYKLQLHQLSLKTILQMLPLKKGTESDWEVLLNAFFYVPFAVGLARCLAQKKSPKSFTILFAVLLASGATSYAIEFLQCFLPGRFPSRLDLFGNTLGGLLGFALFYVIHTKTLASMFVAYTGVMLLVSIPLQRATTLVNWDPSFLLLVGNEQTGDRPWDGQVEQFYIADRALSESEVKILPIRTDPAAFLGDSLIAYYKFYGPNGYHDDLGRLPDLALKEEAPTTLLNNNAVQPSHRWFEARKEMAFLTERLVRTSQFTLGVSLTSHSDNQTGPARIISLSADTVRRNFTLAQEGSDLVFRLRTPFTGQNGGKPPLIVPNVFETKELTDIVITYNGTDLLIFVNGILSREELPLTPGAVAFGHFFRSSALRLKTSNVLYHGALFLPVGFLLSFNPKIRIARIATGVILPSLLLEAILVAISGRAPQLSHVLLGFIFTLVGVLLLRNRNSFCLRFRAYP